MPLSLKDHDMQHTKGPWSYDDKEAIQTDEHLIALVCGENYGQWRNAPDGGRAEFAANGRLIAAAPELFDALQEQVSAELSGDGARMAKARHVSRAAIARATGGQS